MLRRERVLPVEVRASLEVKEAVVDHLVADAVVDVDVQAVELVLPVV
jgi:hypothetical protein